MYKFSLCMCGRANESVCLCWHVKVGDEIWLKFSLHTKVN
jgi:hypothetical protein